MFVLSDEDVFHHSEAGFGHHKLDFAQGFQKYIILLVFSEKLLSRTSPYLEDVIHLPEVPDGDQDGWGHLH